MARKAGGNNPIKYSDIFDLADKSVINELVKNIKKVDKEYEKLRDTIQNSADIARNSFLRMAKDMLEASNKLNLALANDREGILALVNAVNELKQHQKTQQQTQQQNTTVINAAADSVLGLKKRIKDLTDEYNKLSKADAAEAARMAEIAKEVKELTKDQKQLTQAMKAGREQVEYAAGSYKALEERTKQLMKELKELPNTFDKTSKKAKELQKEIFENNKKLKQFDELLNIHTRNVGNYGSALGGINGILGNFAVGIAAAYAGFSSLSDFGEQVVQTNVEVSDSLADVQRTAELTGKEANALAEQLKKIDTRTSLKGLIDLAVIGGQLGFQTVDDLKGFSKAIDELAVTLSGEIEGGAEKIATGVGKINGVFKVAQKEGETVERAFLKTGSSILKLGQAGLATGENLVDFTQRVGSVAANAGLTIPQIQAYGAVLEESGQSAEVSGTAFQALLVKLAVAPEKFHAVAAAANPELTLKQFTEYVNTDTKKALDVFFAGLSKTGGKTTDFAQIVKLLGVEGKKSVSTLTALAKNQELLATRTTQAEKAYKDGTLATEQFRIKNENLAAALEKAKNSIFNAFTDSSAAAGLAKFINGLVDGKTEGEELTETFVRQTEQFDDTQAAMEPLLVTYDSLKKKAKELGGENKLTKDEQQKLNETIQAIAELMPAAITEVDKYGNAIDIARGKIAGLTTEMQKNIKLSSQTAAKELREEIAERQKLIKVNQDLAKASPAVAATTGYSKDYLGGIGMETDFFGKSTSNAQQEIAKNALANAEAIKKLKDVLLQDLSPAEQQVYDRFYKDQKRAAVTAKETGEDTDDAAENTIDTLKDLGSHAKRTYTEIEKLEKVVEKLKNQLQSQALNGKVNNQTLDEFVHATERLEEAQRTANEAITAGIDPIKNLQNQQAYLNEKLQRESGLGKDTTQTISELSSVTEELKEKQNAVNLELASTVGQMELLNAKIEINRKIIEQQIANGEDYSDALQTLGEDTLEVERVTKLMNEAILKVTKPMEYLALQADKYREMLSEQVANGEANTETIEAYTKAINDLYLAQEKLKKATEYDPTDPRGAVKSLNLSLGEVEREQIRSSPGAEAGNPEDIKRYRQLEFEKLRITLDMLDEKQKAYAAGSQEYSDIETQKTQITADQEKLRTEITKEESQKRAELVQQGLELLSTGISGFYDIQKQQRENEISDLENQKDKEIDLAGNNTTAKEKIEEKYAKKVAEIKTKQAQADKNQALFNVAIQTATGASRAISEFPETFGMPFLAFVLAQGVAQAALIAARPLPKYYKGRGTGPAEWAHLGERGSEAIESTDGSVRVTKSGDHIGFLKAGDKVHTADSAETAYYMSLLSAAGAFSGGGMDMYNASADAISRARQQYEIENSARAFQMMASGLNPDALKQAFGAALDSRPSENTYIDEDGFNTYLQDRNARIHTMNRRHSLRGEG